MPASKAQREKAAERRAKGAALRLAGLSYDEIAKKLGYSGAVAAYRDVKRAFAASTAEPAEPTPAGAAEQVALELLRLDRLQVAAWAAAVQGDLRAIDTVTRIIGTRARLLRWAEPKPAVVDPEPVKGVGGIADLTARIAERRASPSG